MRVQIFSMIAAVGGSDSVQWDGDVPDATFPERPSQHGVCEQCAAREQFDPGICAEADHVGSWIDLDKRWEETVNERIFRFFNRVDSMDGVRLSKLGYDLPSLSVGDFVTWGMTTYKVESLGFAKVTRNPEFILSNFYSR